MTGFRKIYYTKTYDKFSRPRLTKACLGQSLGMSHGREGHKSGRKLRFDVIIVIGWLQADFQVHLSRVSVLI